MATGGNHDQEYNREFYHHVEDVKQLVLARADKDPVWKDVLPLCMRSDSKVHHTVKCTQVYNNNNNCQTVNTREVIKWLTTSLLLSSLTEHNYETRPMVCNLVYVYVHARLQSCLYALLHCSIGREDATRLKQRLKEFIKEETEQLKDGSSIRLEARYFSIHEV